MIGDFGCPLISSATYFLCAQKVSKKAPEPSFRTSFYSSRFLVGLRHPCPFDWQLSSGFRWRPPFFIREKRRRFSASCLKWRGFLKVDLPANRDELEKFILKLFRIRIVFGVGGFFNGGYATG
jgi:hypothetical protein